MLQPNNSSPTRTQRRKTATDSLDGSALPIATPTNAPTSAIIAGTTRGAAEPVVETEPERHRQRRHKVEIANAFAEREPRAGAEIRLQAAVVRKAVLRFILREAR